MISRQAKRFWAILKSYPKQIEMPLSEARESDLLAEYLTSEPTGVAFLPAPEVDGFWAAGRLSHLGRRLSRSRRRHPLDWQLGPHARHEKRRLRNWHRDNLTNMFANALNSFVPLLDPTSARVSRWTEPVEWRRWESSKIADRRVRRIRAQLLGGNCIRSTLMQEVDARTELDPDATTEFHREEPEDRRNLCALRAGPAQWHSRFKSKV